MSKPAEIDTEQRLRSLMMNSAQPQEGSLKPNDAAIRDYRDVREVFQNSNDVDALDADEKAESPPFFSSPLEFRQAVRSGQFTFL